MEIQKSEAPTKNFLQLVRAREEIIERPPEYFANLFINEINKVIKNESAHVRDRTTLNFVIAYPEGVEPSEKVKTLVRNSLLAAGWKEVDLFPTGYRIYFTLTPDKEKQIKEKDKVSFLAKLKAFFS